MIQQKKKKNTADVTWRKDHCMIQWTHFSELTAKIQITGMNQLNMIC